MNNHIRLQQLVVSVSKSTLSLVFDTLAQTGLLQHTFKDQFAPITLRLSVAFQGASQIHGLLVDLHVQQTQVREFLPE